MRLFIACDLPENVRKKLVTLQNTLGSENARIKWVEQKNIHLTMKFLGEVSYDKVAGIKEALGNVEHGAMSCSVSGFGVFPSESYIRVMWVGLEPEKEIQELHTKIDDSLSGLGFGPEKRFQSHVTLGRVKSVVNKPGLLAHISKVRESKLGDTELGSPFSMEDFRLKQSTLTPNGPIYEDVAVFGLR